MSEWLIGWKNIKAQVRSYLDVLKGRTNIFVVYNTLYILHILPFINMRNWIPRKIESNASRWSSIIPQALDDATMGIYGYLGAISLYIAYALIKDFRNAQCNIMSNCCDAKDDESVDPQSEEKQTKQEVVIQPRNVPLPGERVSQRDGSRDFAFRRLVNPQSEEITQNMGAGNMKSQNVQFVDASPGYDTMIRGEIDSLRGAAMATDASLEEFFSRPLKIFDTEWGVGSTLAQSFNPWAEYFNNVNVINRIANYRLLTARLCIKVLINGNAFHYGRAILSYEPLPDDDEYTVNRSFIDADLVEATQRPHIYLNPTESVGGSMCLPFFWYDNTLDIVSTNWDKMGICTLTDMNELKHANGATDTVRINVFAWAEDVKFAIPTDIDPGSIQPQADEYGKGVVSKPASVVANVASKMTMIPSIAPFARATEIAANGISAMASLFGYSRPTQLEKSTYRPMMKHDWAVTDLEDDVNKLSVTAKQELTLDPRTVGLSDVDELGINYIAGRESYLTKIPWAENTVSESLLWSCVVDPGLKADFEDEFHFPAPAFASLPFEYWRGSMEFRFQVVCSKFHRGRLKIVYDPTGNNSIAPGLGVSEYNTAYTTIVDISDTTDFTFCCGWGQPQTYRSRYPVNSGISGVAYSNGDPPVSYKANSTAVGNGTISVYVVNELTVPNSTIDNDISVNVFIKMCDDFEVASPSNEHTQLRTTTAAITEPQSEEIADVDYNNAAPMETEVVNTAGNKTDLTDYTNHVYFGESIRSFRQMLKRYNFHEVLTYPTSDLSTIIPIEGRYRRHTMPFEPGYVSVARNGPVTKALASGDYAYGNMTLLRYITLGYAGWRGGIRWIHDFSEGTWKMRSQITRLSFPTGMDNSVSEVIGQANTNAAIASNIGQHTGSSMGTVRVDSPVNSLVAAEIPFYSIRRFYPAKKRPDFSSLGQAFTDSFDISVKGDVVGTDYATTWVAAAEDFNCFFYVGPPIFYYEASRPTS